MTSDRPSTYAPITPGPAVRKSSVRHVSLLSGKQYSKIIGTIEKVRQATKLSDSLTPPQFRLPSDAVAGSTFRDDVEFFEAPLNSRISKSSPRDFPDEKVPLNGLTFEEHEALIVKDLLFVLMGIEGCYITLHPDYSEELAQGPAFIIDQTLDPSLRDLTEKLLPVAFYYVSIEAFIERYSRFEFGMINHALCAAIRGLLIDYLVLIAQLEHQFRTEPTFTLQTLWFYVHPSLDSLSLIWAICSEIRESRSTSDSDKEEEEDDKFTHVIGDSDSLHCVGGRVLGLLSEKLIAQSGNPTSQKLYRHLLSHASVPYLHMLNRWIHHGEIVDPYDEFFIRESKSVRKENLDTDYTDEYWEKRYTLRSEMTPLFLEAHKDKILLAGKYLNVLRECGRGDLDIGEINYTLQDLETEHGMISHTFAENVDKAYARANSALLDLLLNDQKLDARLQALKHYFLLDQSDFFTHFLDTTFHELYKPSKSVSKTKLQSLLDLALRNPSSVSANDPYKEDLRVSMANMSLVDALMRIISVQGLQEGRQDDAMGVEIEENEMAHQSSQGASNNNVSTMNSNKPLTGIEALVFDYNVKFPLSLVISRKTLFRYQLIFRHLLYLKHVEQRLLKAWLDQTKSPIWRKSSSEEIQTLKMRAYLLRTKMLNFIQQLAYFTTFEVIEPQWMRFKKKLDNVPTVDQLLQDHVDFLDSCLKESMLTNAKLLKIYSKLMSSCLLFANYSGYFTKAIEKGGGEGVTTLLKKFEDNFNANLRVLVEALNWYAATETLGFLHLVVRLEQKM